MAHLFPRALALAVCWMHRQVRAQGVQSHFEPLRGHTGYEERLTEGRGMGSGQVERPLRMWSAGGSDRAGTVESAPG